jgi:hypothetical protein
LSFSSILPVVFESGFVILFKVGLDVVELEIDLTCVLTEGQNALVAVRLQSPAANGEEFAGFGYSEPLIREF